MKTKNNLECPYCGSKGLYTNKDGTRRCKKCGEIWKKGGNKNEKFKIKHNSRA